MLSRRSRLLRWSRRTISQKKLHSASSGSCHRSLFERTKTKLLTLVSCCGQDPVVSVTGIMTDLTARYNKNIRPLIDAIDRLRNLKVTSEGIPLPSIVVVGDQSSGKSSVLESLATITLPRGKGIVTRVPLVLELQSCKSLEDSLITISYDDTTKVIVEGNIKEEIDAATNVLAGTGKGVVTEKAISLHIRKPDAPDLTMIDLPGITRVPIHGQPANIYEQISAMIRKYIKPKETVILNVLSANVDFTTCESIRMSQEEDVLGERTLAVVTKVDKVPDEVLKKVTEDDVNIGLGYICVRNRAGDEESHEDARLKERDLFERHPALSQLDKGSVGIPALAERLTQIQANIIRSSLPGIQEQIDKALQERRKELEAMPDLALWGEDLSEAFLNVVDVNKTLMQEIIIDGNYDKVLNEKGMHYSARLDEMFESFSNSLHKVVEKIIPEARTQEILLRMNEMRGLNLPNFLSPTLMKTLVSEEIQKVSEVCIDLVPQTHDYALKVAYNVIEKSTSEFPNLHAAFKQEAGKVLDQCKRKCMKYVQRVLNKEKSNVFTMNDYYMSTVHKIRDHLIERRSGESDARDVKFEGFNGLCNLAENDNKSNEYQSAFDMKVNLAAYCKVVQKRMSDEIPMEIRYALENALLRTLRRAIVRAKLGQDMVSLMEENTSTLHKRVTLRARVETLSQCKAVLQQLI